MAPSTLPGGLDALSSTAANLASTEPVYSTIPALYLYNRLFKVVDKKEELTPAILHERVHSQATSSTPLSVSITTPLIDQITD
jgi:hypothetical protein